MQFLCFASRSNPVILHPHHHQESVPLESMCRYAIHLIKSYMSSSLDLLCDLLDLLMVTTEVWLGNRLPGLPKNTGVIICCLKVLWKTLKRPKYYNITIIYVNTCFWYKCGRIYASVMGACYTSHMVSQVAVFGYSLPYYHWTAFAKLTLAQFLLGSFILLSSQILFWSMSNYFLLLYDFCLKISAHEQLLQPAKSFWTHFCKNVTSMSHAAPLPNWSSNRQQVRCSSSLQVAISPLIPVYYVWCVG